MPRLHGYVEYSTHDFGWVVELGDKPIRLFQHETVFPQQFEHQQQLAQARETGHWLFEHSLCITELSVDKLDAQLEISIGGKQPYFFSGPWLSNVRNNVIGLMSVFADAIKEGRAPDDVKELIGELLKEGTPSSLPHRLVVPVRQALRPTLWLLPGGQHGRCHVHMRTVIRREIQ